VIFPGAAEADVLRRKKRERRFAETLAMTGEGRDHDAMMTLEEP
jgi:hypothetical protein